MQRIIFLTLLFCISAIVLKAQVPKRTSDPSQAISKTTVSLPLKTGGGGTATNAPKAVLPVRTNDGGGSGSGSAKTVQGLPATRFSAVPRNTNGSRPPTPSMLAVKQDSLQKH
jgi:hypothetical protein